jgi:predicted CoA-binding protein
MSHDAALDLLRNSQSIAIVGISDKPDRASNQVAQYLVDHSDYTLYFVNPAIKELFGEPVYASLTEIPAHVDIVDVFRKVEDMPQILDEAISIGAKAFWMQLGLRDEALAKTGEEAGLTVVQDKCIKIEHQRI